MVRRVDSKSTVWGFESLPQDHFMEAVAGACIDGCGGSIPLDNLSLTLSSLLLLKEW